MTMSVQREFAATIVYSGALRTPQRFNTERLIAAIILIRDDNEHTGASWTEAVTALVELYPAMTRGEAGDYLTAAEAIIGHNLVQEATA